MSHGDAATYVDDYDQEGIAFSRDPHICLGKAVARRELRPSRNCIPDHPGDVHTDEDEHRPVGQRCFEYDKPFLMRGLERLDLKLSPIPNRLRSA